jgi:hypothetical protein
MLAHWSVDKQKQIQFTPQNKLQISVRILNETKNLEIDLRFMLD